VRSILRLWPVTFVVLGLFATSCAVDPIELEIATVQPPRTISIKGAIASEAEADVLAYETNDDGDVLLPRFITGSYRTDDCDFIDVDALPVEPECGWLVRPLHGSTHKEVQLPVTVFRSTGSDPAADPLIYLHGGPTDGILSFIEYVYEFVVEPFVEDRDVIVFDQRGTGLAEPDLRCDSPFQWFSARDEDPETFVPRVASVCAFEVQSDGIRLDQFSRQLSADDVMVLARELGYESFNLHGSSWGGILAYTVMQLHPEWVRSSVLDSPLSIATDITGSMPSSFHEAMMAVQANCDISPDCSARHGDIVERYVRVFEALEDQPREIQLGPWAVTLTADELSYLLFGLLYDHEAIAMVPDMLLDLENGSVTLLEQLASSHGWGWGVDFTFLTYMCTDMVAVSSVEQVEAQQIGIEAFDRVDDAPDGRGHTAAGICERMKVQKPAAPAVREVTPTTPTIVFSGSMDPITPRSSGEQIAATVANGTFVGFDDLSHGVTNVPCGIEIAKAFLADPDAPVDQSCVDERPPFTFDNVSLTIGG